MIDYCPWCSAPETICPHWIGLDCELIEKEIDFKALERYLIKYYDFYYDEVSNCYIMRAKAYGREP